MPAELTPSRSAEPRAGGIGTGEDEPRLIEFDGSLHTDWWWIIPLVMLFPTALMVGAVLREYVFTGLGTLVALVVIVLYACYLKSTRDVGRLAGLLDDEAIAGLRLVLRRGTPLYKLIDVLVAWPRYLARALAGRGLAGYVLSVGNRYDLRRSPIEPLAVPFEPVPLDATDAAFRELASCGADPKTMRPAARGRFRVGKLSRQMYPMMVATGTATLLVHGLSYWTKAGRSLYPDWTSLGISSLVPVMLFVQVLIRSPGTNLIYGPVFLFLVYMDLFVIWPTRWIRLLVLTGWVALMTAWFAWRSPAQGVWLFPGGLLRRGRREVYRRESALLIWHQQRLCIVDARQKRFFFLDVSREEAILTVRAWLSPAAAPSDEMIAAFLGPV